VQKLATNPSCQRFLNAIPPNPKMEHKAHKHPAAPEPKTLLGPRLPFLFSATPSASFYFSFSFGSSSAT